MHEKGERFLPVTEASRILFGINIEAGIIIVAMGVTGIRILILAYGEPC